MITYGETENSKPLDIQYENIYIKCSHTNL